MENVQWEDKERLLEFIKEISVDLRDSDEELVDVLEGVSMMVEQNKSSVLSLYDTDEVIEFLAEWSDRTKKDEPPLSKDLRTAIDVVKNLEE